MYFCCFCLPLQLGCMLAGCLYIVFGGANLILDSKIFKFLEEDEWDDEENLEQKRRVRSLYTFFVCFEAAVIAVGLIIIAAAIRHWACVLKICAVASAILSVVPIVRLFVFGLHAGVLKIMLAVVSTVALLYTAYALWSLARLFLNPDDDEHANPVANIFRGGGVPPPQLRGGFPASYPYAPAYYPPSGSQGQVGRVGGQAVTVAPPGHPGPGVPGLPGHPGAPNYGYPGTAPYPGPQGRGLPGQTDSSSEIALGPSAPPEPFPPPYPGYPGPASQGWNDPKQNTGANQMQSARMFGMMPGFGMPRR